MNALFMTVAQVQARISLTKERLDQLNDEACELALPAVAGSDEAAAALARIHGEVRQISDDLVILERAKLTAADLQRAADEAVTEAYRARHLSVAQDRAAEIVKLAVRADALVAEFQTVFTVIASTEQEILEALRRAGKPPTGDRVGQGGLNAFVIAALTAQVDGTARYRRSRPVAEIATSAWADLLKNVRGDDA